MSRIRYVGALVLCCAATAKLAVAESQADIAARENDEGKELMYGGKYADASAKFRDAVARVPEPKYFFNLCTSLFQEGKFGEALTACNSAGKANQDDKLKDKIDKLEQRIKDTATAQGLDLHPVGGGGGDPNVPATDPNAATAGATPPADPYATPPSSPPTTDPNAATAGTAATGGQVQPPSTVVAQPTVQYQPVVGRPPDQALFRAAPPDHSYLWTIGFDAFAGGATFQGLQGNAYGHVSEGFRIKSDFLFNRPWRLGAEAFLSYTSVTNNANAMTQAMIGELDILEAGVGIYKHLCLRNVERLCLTPLVGVGLAFMDPNQDQDQSTQTFNYLGASARLELAANFAFGRRYQNVLSVAIDGRFYTPAFSDPTDGSPTRMEVGLDQPGQIVSLNIGYTYRFNTPLGGRAFITLE
jgi:hypothetical protein